MNVSLSRLPPREGPKHVVIVYHCFNQSAMLEFCHLEEDHVESKVEGRVEAKKFNIIKFVLMPPIRFLMQRLAMFSFVERGKRAARALDRAGWGSGIIRRLQCVRPYVVQV
jgi:hypothetical protein